MRAPQKLRFSAVPLRSVILLAFLASAACEDTNAPEDAFSILPGSAAVVVGEGVQFTALNAPGTINWSSNDTQIATVVPETGYVIGQGRGEATISAVSEGVVATATVSVSLPPAIGLSSPTFEFSKTLGGIDPVAQTLNVTNTGDGDLSNITVGPVQYGQGQPTGWLTVAAGGTVAPFGVTLTARGTSLPRGIYTATVPVSAPGIDNSPQTFAVTFRVNSPPSIVVSNPLVPLAGIPGTVLTESVDIANGGDVTLSGLTRVITYGVGPTNWLTATLGSTTAPTTLSLSANTAGLPLGTHTANVRLSSNLPGVADADVQVKLTVNPGPAIAVSQNNVTVQATNGSNASAQMLTITNSGGGTLTGLAIGTIFYGASQPTGWVSASLSTTTAPATVTLSFNTAALPTGSYSATVPITSPVASNSPLNVGVQLTVGPPPSIELSPTNVAFATWGGSPSLPGSQPVVVNNGGGGTLNGLTASIQYNTGATGWLTAQFQGSNTAPTIVLLRPNTTSLGAGTHTATVTISSNLPGVASRTVAVSYTIQTFTVNIHPTTQASCLGGGCHSGNSPIMNVSAATLCSNLKTGGYVTANNPSGSTFYTRPRSSGHSGGQFLSFSNVVAAWINAGAPCS
jgi:Bacterial Ig-like domain (group 2)